jgi:hypothetical protein
VRADCNHDVNPTEGSRAGPRYEARELVIGSAAVFPRVLLRLTSAGEQPPAHRIARSAGQARRPDNAQALIPGCVTARADNTALIRICRNR